MKFLIIGLGSMGKRRIRCLQSLGYKDIYVFDINQKRVKESVKKYEVKSINDPFEYAKKNFLNALIISTSPESHINYIPLAFKNNLPTFIEASVCDVKKLENIILENKNSKVFIAPSCTMKYFEGPKILKKLISEKLIGEIYYFDYRTGQYLHDWHPWEDINDYYVTNPKTGGCREIVPFELTWLNDIFGYPEIISSFKNRIGLKNVDIDDYYHFSLRYPSRIIGNITVEVLSRPFALREMRLTGEKGQIVFNQDDNLIKYATNNNEWKIIKIKDFQKEEGYINPEQPYIDELNDFIKSIKEKNNKFFPNNIKKDIDILKLLESIEKSCLN